MATILSVNRATPGVSSDVAKTGIDKRPVDGPVTVRAPGPMQGGQGSGVVGDVIVGRDVHGGDDQAVYAYAREDLDDWERRLERTLSSGTFGENLTTAGVDTTGALIGERWRIGRDGPLLEVSRPRVPCQKFVTFLGIRGWIKTFTKQAVPGAYLRVVEPGEIAAGDTVEVVERPGHRVSVGMVFRAMTLEPDLLGDILAADALPAEISEMARRRIGA